METEPGVDALDDKAEELQGRTGTNYFYEKTVPEKDELVMVRVNSIDDMGVLCSLLEYDELQGFLPLSEISRKRMRSVLRHVRVGQKQVLQVIRVDTERGYTDLSKKYISEVERSAGTEKYNKGKTVHSIAKRLAETKHMEIQEIYKSLIWPLYKNYEHPYDAFKILASSDAIADVYKGLEVPPDDLKDALLKFVKHQLAVQPVKIGAEVDVTSFVGGIDDIKTALKAGLEVGGGESYVKIQLVSSPTFLIWTTTVDEQAGIASLESVITVIQEEITKLGGNFSVLKEPAVIGKVEAKAPVGDLL
jgi:translation initiation factor 2 subunit 1